MFGILVGAGLVVAGTVALVRHRHGVHRTMFACALRRLKATDEQKQQLTSLFDDTQVRLSSTKERARSLRHTLADIWAAPVVDAQRLEALESQLFEVLGEGTQTFRAFMTRAHDVLQPSQRQQLADWVRRAHRHRHHHCHPAGCCC